MKLKKKLLKEGFTQIWKKRDLISDNIYTTNAIYREDNTLRIYLDKGKILYDDLKRNDRRESKKPQVHKGFVGWINCALIKPTNPNDISHNNTL